jgi:ketosteroid isomerase-like protein
MSLTQAERDEIHGTLVAMATTIKQSYATNDVELYLSAFDSDVIVSMPGMPPLRGHDELRTAFANRPPLPPGATFEVNPLELEPISPDWAYAYGTDTVTHADGAKETITFLVLIRKTAEGWKTFREVLSADQS